MIALILGAMLAAAEVPTGPAAAPATPAAAAAAAPEAAQPKPKGSERVCWSERPTGSHMLQTVCGTRDELDAIQRSAEDGLRNKPRNSPPPGAFH